MRRLTSSKSKLREVKKNEAIFIVSGNDLVMSASFNEETAKREVKRLKDGEDRALSAAIRQGIGVASPIHYYVTKVKILEDC